MGIKWIFIVILLILMLAFYANGHNEKQPIFKSATVTSSQQIYDLFEADASKIYFVAFYIQGKKHEKIIEDVESSLWSKKRIIW